MARRDPAGTPEAPERHATGAPLHRDDDGLGRVLARAVAARAARRSPAVLLQREVSYLSVPPKYSAVRYESRTAEGKTRYEVFHPKDHPFDAEVKQAIEKMLPPPPSSTGVRDGPFAHLDVSLESHPFAGLSLGSHPFQALKETSDDVGLARKDVVYKPEHSAYIAVEGWGIRFFYPHEDDRCDVHLPSDFPADKVDLVAAAIKGKRRSARLKFVNEQGDTVLNVATVDERKRLVPKVLNRDEKQQQAMRYLEAYLAKHGLLGDFKDLLTNQMRRISFDDKPEGWFQTAMQLAGEKDAERAANTEGITPTKVGVGSRTVFMNASNFTVRAIVHELLHALSHPAVDSMSWVEGLTEYLTLQATGLNIRTAVSGATIYSKDVAALRTALKKTDVTEEELVQAYFRGKMGRLGEISELMTM
jgi:hypothetical protein